MRICPSLIAWLLYAEGMTIRNIVVLTGAGVSAESGLATFRGPDGLWEGHRVEDVCTPEAYRRNPALVHAFYDERRAKLGTVQPNAAHAALARLDAEWQGELLLITQNVDDLHERAGSERLIHMHGELTSGWCLACDERFPWEGPMGEGASCPSCSATGRVRPDIVWFGEMPYGAVTCSRRSEPPAPSIPRPGSSRPRAIAERGRSRSTLNRALAAACSTRAGSARLALWCQNGWMGF
jgi:NAD-dependent SIR2 family protein deacetylase